MIASPLHTASQQDGGAIPGAEGMNAGPSPTVSQRDIGAIQGTEGPVQQDGGATLGTNPSPTDSSAAPIHLPQLPRRDDGEISYESQGRLWFYNFEIITDIPFQSTSC